MLIFIYLNIYLFISTAFREGGKVERKASASISGDQEAPNLKEENQIIIVFNSAKLVYICYLIGIFIQP